MYDVDAEDKVIVSISYVNLKMFWLNDKTVCFVWIVECVI